MHALFLILYVIAAVCLAIAAFFPQTSARVNLVALGLLAWVLVPLVQTART